MGETRCTDVRCGADNAHCAQLSATDETVDAPSSAPCSVLSCTRRCTHAVVGRRNGASVADLVPVDFRKIASAQISKLTRCSDLAPRHRLAVLVSLLASCQVLVQDGCVRVGCEDDARSSETDRRAAVTTPDNTKVLRCVSAQHCGRLGGLIRPSGTRASGRRPAQIVVPVPPLHSPRAQHSKRCQHCFILHNSLLSLFSPTTPRFSPTDLLITLSSPLPPHF